MILLDPSGPVVGFIVADAQAAAVTSTFARWLSILGGLTVVLGFLGIVWAKGIRPLLKKLDFVEAQMSSNGLSRGAGTENLNLRDALDQNTRDTRTLTAIVDNVRSRTELRHEENQHAIADLRGAVDHLGDRLTADVDRQAAIEAKQRDNVEWAFDKFVELHDRLVALEPTKPVPPEPGPEEGA